ncbi:4345_t:CDS:1, partial [Dentiscutata heterogama]
MSLTELSTNFMHTQPFQIGSLDYDPKIQSIFPTYSINAFRSSRTPITYVHSNTDIMTDPINARTQPAILYTETSLHRHVDLANNRTSPIHQANYAPITA